MAVKKGYVSNKEKKRQALMEEKRKKSYKSPSKTLWGKAAIIILILGMIALPIVFIIMYFLQ